jgi:hypothetical protein
MTQSNINKYIEFQSIYEEEFGTKLSRQEAKDKGQRLLKLMQKIINRKGDLIND